jgi:hypothetical protein
MEASSASNNIINFNLKYYWQAISYYSSIESRMAGKKTIIFNHLNLMKIFAIDDIGGN